MSAGEVFGCDTNNYRLQVFGLDGSFVREWGTKGRDVGQFCYPRSVVVSGEEVIVLEIFRIQVFGLDGSFLRQWGTWGEREGEFHDPTGVSVSCGEVFVCDCDNDRIQVFGLDGSFLRQWGGQFLPRPRHVLVSGGEVYVSEHDSTVILVCGLDGSLLRRLLTEAKGVFGGVTISGDEMVVCAEMPQENLLQVFGLDGSRLRNVHVQGQLTPYVDDMTVSDGNLFVCGANPGPGVPMVSTMRAN